MSSGGSGTPRLSVTSNSGTSSPRGVPTSFPSSLQQRPPSLLSQASSASDSSQWTDDLPVCVLSGVGYATNQIYRKVLPDDANGVLLWVVILVTRNFMPENSFSRMDFELHCTSSRTVRFASSSTKTLTSTAYSTVTRDRWPRILPPSGCLPKYYWASCRARRKTTMSRPSCTRSVEDEMKLK